MSYLCQRKCLPVNYNVVAAIFEIVSFCHTWPQPHAARINLCYAIHYGRRASSSRPTSSAPRQQQLDDRLRLPGWESPLLPGNETEPNAAIFPQLLIKLSTAPSRCGRSSCALKSIFPPALLPKYAQMCKCSRNFCLITTPGSLAPIRHRGLCLAK